MPDAKLQRGPVAIHPEPLVLPAGAALSPKAFVVSPANLEWSGPELDHRETRVHRGPVYALACSPDSSKLAAAGDDGIVAAELLGRMVRANCSAF